MKKRVDGMRADSVYYSRRSTYTFFMQRRLERRDDGVEITTSSTEECSCVTPLNTCHHLHALLHELRPANRSICRRVLYLI